VKIDSRLDAFKDSISNRLTIPVGKRRIAGVVGDIPSQYSKSPALWNAAFSLLGINAVYLPFDVRQDRLGDFIGVLRDSQSLLGVNVTVPHKVKIIEYLDELDSGAARVQAVNTVLRTRQGRLIGYNTDGLGLVESLLRREPDQATPFLESLTGLDVLLLGAGGSARAVAFHVADRLNGGKLVICNRSIEAARALALDVRNAGARDASGIGEDQLPEFAPQAGLIINSTTKGQGGIHRSSKDSLITMEAYSSLAPARPLALAESVDGSSDFQRRWSDANQADIHANNQASLNLARSIPQSTAFYDLIYHPPETVFLRHGRLSGHRIMNGRGMIVWQAALACFHHLCADELRSMKLHSPETLHRIAETMYRAW
jgi:shikimate dehydrogenase